MARASASRGGKQRRPNARAQRSAPAERAVTKRKKAPSYEDQLFLTRLRRHMKWVFVVLTFAFAIGFVVYGVGSGSGGGNVGDVLRNAIGKGSGGPSVKDAQKKVEQHPNDPKALSELATALQTEGRNPEAIDVLKRYAELRPGDANVLLQLTALYEIQAANANRRASELMAQSAAGTIGAVAFSFPTSTGFLGAVGSDPIDQSVQQAVAAKANDARAEATSIYASEVPVYEQLVKLTPEEPILYIQLGQAASGANETQKAIDAYTKFLQLAPDDPNAKFVKDQLKVLGAPSDVVTG